MALKEGDSEALFHEHEGIQHHIGVAWVIMILAGLTLLPQVGLAVVFGLPFVGVAVAIICAAVTGGAWRWLGHLKLRRQLVRGQIRDDEFKRLTREAAVAAINRRCLDCGAYGGGCGHSPWGYW